MNIAKLSIPSIGDLADPTRPVVGLSRDHPVRHHYPAHRHYRAQLLFAARGVMTVEARDGRWVVPPLQAVWIPAGVEHEVRADGPLELRSLYVHPTAARRLSRVCAVLEVTPLLRALVLKVVSLSAADQATPRARRLLAVLLDELAEIDPTPLHLPMPTDSRIKAVSAALILDPSDSRGLDEMARSAGASARTLARLFLNETGMTFGQWRQRLRLLAAIARLGSGDPVSAIAYDMGYQSPSAFVAMFRRAMGEPPARYLRRDGGAT